MKFSITKDIRWEEPDLFITVEPSDSNFKMFEEINVGDYLTNSFNGMFKVCKITDEGVTVKVRKSNMNYKKCVGFVEDFKNQNLKLASEKEVEEYEDRLCLL